MAANSKIQVSPTNPKHRAWLSTGRKGQIAPSTSPLHVSEDEEIYSAGPAKQMKQIRKRKSEKGKMSISASTNDFPMGKTVWHVSLPSIHDVQPSSSGGIGGTSPKRRPMATSPLPPPPSNPPPVLNQEKMSNSEEDARALELAKTVPTPIVNSAVPVVTKGAVKSLTRKGVIKPLQTKARVDKEKEEEKSEKDGDGQHRKNPLKHPPPYTAKAKAVAVVSMAIQEHIQSSTRSAPGQLQKNDEREKVMKTNESERNVSNRMRSESTGNKLLFSTSSNGALNDERTEVKAKPLKPRPYASRPPTKSEASESPLTSSTEGGVKSLARLFSARSKEDLSVTAKGNGSSMVKSQSPKQCTLLRPVKGRKILKEFSQKEMSIPETNEEDESMSVSAKKNQRKETRALSSTQSCRPLPIPPIDEDPAEKNEVLQNVESVISSGTPTHMSLFSWYNKGSGATCNKGDQDPLPPRRYQNVFDDEAFARFDKTRTTEEEEGKVPSPGGPYKEYQNVLVDSAKLDMQSSKGSTRVETDAQSDREENRKEKKPIPLPRVQSKKNGQLFSSKSEGSLSVADYHTSVYEAMAPQVPPRSETISKGSGRQESSTSEEAEAATEPMSPDMIVLGSLDPEWRENYKELIEKEIEMAEEASESDTLSEFSQHVDGVEATSRYQNIGPGLPSTHVGPKPPVPVQKISLKKTQSHNLQEPSIRRRNTPKEKRELRKGVCSESDHMELKEEQDDYIPMKSAQLPNGSYVVNSTPLPTLSSPEAHSQLLSAPTVPKSVPNMDPRSSAYYLKILPHNSPPALVKLAEQPSSVETPTRVKHTYIEIDVLDDASEDLGLVQQRVDIPRSPTLPPRTKTDGGSPPTTKRKLKYSKVDVGPPKSSTIIDNTRAGAKRSIPYSRVKLGSGDTTTVPPSDHGSHPGKEGQHSQGSSFAKEMLTHVDHPLPPTPHENSIYYKTVNHPLSHIPAMRHVWHHEYIEIDEEELNKKKQVSSPEITPSPKTAHAVSGPIRVPNTKNRSHSAAPPPVPQRPSCPYVEIDGEEIEKMARSLPPPVFSVVLKPNEKADPIMNRTNGNEAQKGQFSSTSLGPKAARKLGPPPAIPGRPDNLSRSRSFSSSDEYSYPFIPGLNFQWLKMRKGDGDKGYFTPQVSIPTTSRPHLTTASGKKNRMDTITERKEVDANRASDLPPRVPPKTESLLREQGLLFTGTLTIPSPYLVPVTSPKKRKFSAPDIYNHIVTPTRSPEFLRPRSPKQVVSSMRKELLTDQSLTTKKEEESTRSEVSDTHSEHSKPWKPPPPRPPPPNVRLTGMKGKGSSSPPRIPKKQRKQSREEAKGSSPVTPPAFKHTDTVITSKESPSVADADAKRHPPDILRVKKTGLQHRIDRNSLAMLVRNKAAIAKQLEKESASSQRERKQFHADEESEGKEQDSSQESVVRSLGDILLEVDSLLQHRLCSEEDLIVAIEKQLNIKLVREKQSTSERVEMDDRAEQKDADENGRKDSVHVTQQDVEEVVNFMNENQESYTNSNSPTEIKNGTKGEEDDGWTERRGIRRNSVIVKNESSQEDVASDIDLSDSPKQRSSTFIVIDDEDLPPWRQRCGTSETSKTTEKLDALPEGDLVQSLPPLADNNAGKRRLGQQRFGVEADFLHSPAENIRDSRSLSVGLKPLRRGRAMARRKTNPAIDMHNISPGK